MLTQRKIARWENSIRREARDNARALAVAIVAGAAWMPPPYDLGVVLEPGEVTWYRCPATYRWRGIDSWTVQRTSHWGHRTVTRQVAATRMFCLGTTDWLVTNLRLATRAWDGHVISIFWEAVCGLSVNLMREVVILDGACDYHGELSGPAVAPIGVAAIAKRHGYIALLDHPSLAPLRVDSPGPGPRLA